MGRRTPANSHQRRSAHETPPPARHYGRLAAFCVSVAAVIVMVLAYRNPPKDPSSPPPANDTLATRASSEPTVALPHAPAEVTAEELRNEGRRFCEDLLARFPRAPEALHAAALLHADLQETTQAEKLWRECIALGPRELGPYIGLANAAMELGQDELAVETLQRVRAAGRSTFDLYAPLATALSKLGRLDEAEQVLQEGVAAFPHAPELWLQWGRTQLQLSQLDAAETSLKEALTQGTTDASVYFLLANVAARQGKSAEAARYRQQFSDRKAEQLASEEKQFQDRYDTEMRRIAVAAICRAGAVLAHQQELSAAEAAFLRALQLAPEDLVALNELAILYRRSGRRADARLVQQRLAAHDPTHIPHHLNLASLSAELGDYEAAEAALREVLRLRPNLAVGYLRLAQLCLQRGNPQQARSFAQQALRQRSAGSGETAQTYLVLAAACGQLGDQAAAEAALGHAQSLNDTPASIPAP